MTVDELAQCIATIGRRPRSDQDSARRTSSRAGGAEGAQEGGKVFSDTNGGKVFVTDGGKVFNNRP